MKNSNMPAMPVPYEDDAPMDRATVERFYQEDCIGLTKLEDAAFRAMQGCWWELTDRGRPDLQEYAAVACVNMARALLAELDKQTD